MKIFLSSVALFFTFFVIAQGTWSSLNSGVSAALISVFAKDSSNVFAVGDGGIMLKTSNGGATWSAVSTPTTASLYKVQFTTTTQGFCVGDAATALKSNDSGSTWSAMSVTTNTGLGFRDMHFPSVNVGYISGGSSSNVGYLFKTINGGTNWSQLSIPAIGTIYGVKFSSDLIGYVTTWNGSIAKTIDGGVTWSVQNIATTQLNDIYIGTGANFAVGRSGTIRKSTDNGTSWSSVTSPVSMAFYGVDFTNATTGFIVGGNITTDTTGVILSTTNAGLVWTSQTPPNCNRLNDLDFPTASVGYAVGMFGTIMKYSQPSSVGLEEILDEVDIVVYPNPSKGNEINLSITSKVIYGDIKFEIYNLDGKRIYENTDQFKSESYTLNALNLEKGTYFINVLLDSKKGATKKIHIF